MSQFFKYYREKMEDSVQALWDIRRTIAHKNLTDNCSEIVKVHYGNHRISFKNSLIKKGHLININVPILWVIQGQAFGNSLQGFVTVNPQ